MSQVADRRFWWPVIGSSARDQPTSSIWWRSPGGLVRGRLTLRLHRDWSWSCIVPACMHASLKLVWGHMCLCVCACMYMSVARRTEQTHVYRSEPLSSQSANSSMLFWYLYANSEPLSSFSDVWKGLLRAWNPNVTSLGTIHRRQLRHRSDTFKSRCVIDNLLRFLCGFFSISVIIFYQKGPSRWKF